MSQPPEGATAELEQTDRPAASAPSTQSAWLVEVHRALAGGPLEDGFGAFATALARQVGFRVALVAWFTSFSGVVASTRTA